MPVPINISDLSSTAGSNAPSGTDTPQEGDNFLRAHGAFIRQLSDRMDGTTSYSPTFNVVTATSFVGNVSTATKLLTARTINGVAFDGTANITVADATKLPLAGGTLTGALVVSSRAHTTSTSVAFSATPTFDAATTNLIVFGNLTANVTSMTISNQQEGQFLTIRFRQDATGGRTVALPAGAKVSGSIEAGANRTSYLNLTYNATDARFEGNWSVIPA